MQREDLTQAELVEIEHDAPDRGELDRCERLPQDRRGRDIEFPAQHDDRLGTEPHPDREVVRGEGQARSEVRVSRPSLRLFSREES
jgi:hypothetical protein